MKEATDERTIYQRIVDISSSIGSIGKGDYNKGQKFNFRGIDSVYNELHSLMSDNGVFSVPTVLSVESEERETRSGGAATIRLATVKYTFYGAKGDSIESIVIGEGMDYGDKSASKSLAIAHKYALLQIFSVPTSEKKDPDGESFEKVPRRQQSYAGEQQAQHEGPRMISDKQRSAIWAKACAVFGADDAKESIVTLCGELGIPSSSKEQTAKHASTLIERLMVLEKQIQGDGPGGY
jgi:hypothetical protein